MFQPSLTASRRLWSLFQRRQLLPHGRSCQRREYLHSSFSTPRCEFLLQSEIQKTILQTLFLVGLPFHSTFDCFRPSSLKNTPVRLKGKAMLSSPFLCPNIGQMPGDGGEGQPESETQTPQRTNPHPQTPAARPNSAARSHRAENSHTTPSPLMEFGTG